MQAHMRRSCRLGVRLFSLLTLVTLLLSCPAYGRTISFKADGGEQEARFLFQQNSKSFILSGWVEPVRNLDGEGRYVVYRFDVSNVEAATLRVRILNNFAISASFDGQTYTEMLREHGRGGSNEGWKTIDLSAFVPSRYRYLYIRFDHGVPGGGAFGACIFELEMELTDTGDVAAGQVAPTCSAITVDGKLDEPAWANAQRLATASDRFMARPVGRQTVFRLSYDNDNIYVGVECEQPGADESIITATTHDSAVYNEDCVEFSFQPPGREEHYHFAINALGVVFDEHVADGMKPWESDAQVAVIATSEGWTVEAAIPWASMKTDVEPGQTWRVAFFRAITEFAQWLAWSCAESGSWHDRTRFGEITFVKATTGALPTVNIVSAADPRMGQNALKISVEGLVDPQRHGLTLNILPVKNPKLPESQQDLEQMNPAYLDLGWPDEATGILETEYPLDRFGSYRLVATLRQKDTAEVLSRAVMSLSLTPENAEPLQVILRQPYVSIEDAIPARITINLTEEKLPGAQVVLNVKDAQGNTVQSVGPVPAQPKMELTIDVKSLAVADYTVVSELFNADGESVAVVENPLGKYQATTRARKVTIGENGLTYVDGEPILPLGFYLGGGGADELKAGYNTGLYGCESLPIDSRCGLDKAAETGTFLMMHVCNYLRGRNDFEGLKARVSRLRNEPALLAWYLADEPEGCGDTPELLGKAYRMIKEIDPDHPVCIGTNAPAMVMHYKDCADIVATDPYPVPTHPLSMVASWTDATVRAATAHGQAPWMIPMGFGWCEYRNEEPSETTRAPTDGEFSTMLYTCFIHGAKGANWWPHCYARTLHWEHFTVMGLQCRILEPWLLFGTDVDGMLGGFQIAGDIHWRAWAHEGRGLIIAANLSYDDPATVTIALPPSVSEAEVPFTYDGKPGTTLTLTDAQLPLALQPAEVKFFLFDLP